MKPAATFCPTTPDHSSGLAEETELFQDAKFVLGGDFFVLPEVCFVYEFGVSA